MACLQDRNALVCGASQGIGRAAAIELARLGASVTVVARSEEALGEVVTEMSSDGGQKHGYLVADFSNRDALREKVAGHVAAVGTVHVLVNNTGGPPAGPVLDADEAALTQAFGNHLLCNQMLVQSVAPGMKQAGFGRIINIISTSVIAPIRGLGVSNTIRGAVANWARTLAGELAPHGITVNNILPGFVDTQRLRSIFEGKAKRTGTTYEAVLAQALATIPTGRLGDPAELGAVIGFLASPEASYLNGVNLPVDGGRTAVQ